MLHERWRIWLLTWGSQKKYIWDIQIRITEEEIITKRIYNKDVGWNFEKPRGIVQGF